MVRHEVRTLPAVSPTCRSTSERYLMVVCFYQAAEAIGAISNPESVEFLRRYLKDEFVEVRETCEIAIEKIEWDNSPEGIEEARKVKEEGSVYVLTFFFSHAITYPYNPPLAAHTTLSTPLPDTTLPFRTRRARRPSLGFPSSPRRTSTPRSRSSSGTALCSPFATSLRRRRRRSRPSPRAFRTSRRSSDTRSPISLDS